MSVSQKSETSSSRETARMRQRPPPDEIGDFGNSGADSVRRVSTARSLREMRMEEVRDLQELEAASLAESLPEGFNAGGRYHKIYWSKQGKYVPILLNILFGAIFGVLARKGLIVLTSYDGSYLSGVIWANFAACVAMGVLIDGSNAWLLLSGSMEFQAKANIGVYVGLSTGFCGTCSSFSSVIVEAFEKSADQVPTHTYTYPNHAYGIMEFLAVTIAQFAVSIFGLYFGKHLSQFFDKYIPPFTVKFYRLVEALLGIVGVASFIIVIVLIATKKAGSWRSWTFSCFFAPFGAYLRFYLSKYLNKKIKNFPLGTFASNIIGTLLLAVFTILNAGKKPGNSNSGIVSKAINCHVLVGLSDGFCGALTTVSTFVVELSGLETIYAYIYSIASIGLSYILCVLIIGSYAWANGLKAPVCI